MASMSPAAAGQQVDGPDAAPGHAAVTGGEFILDVGRRQHRDLGGPVVMADAAGDFALALGQYLVYKSCSLETPPCVVIILMSTTIYYHESEAFRVIFANFQRRDGKNYAWIGTSTIWTFHEILLLLYLLATCIAKRFLRPHHSNQNGLSYL